MGKYYFFLFSFFLACMPFGFAQLNVKLDSIIQKHVKADEPGIALMVEENGKLLYQKAYGTANIESQLAITPQTNFRMASVTKQFTAMGILLLEKTRQLSFDDPLSRFFPEMSVKVASKVYIRHLLTHSSGIVDYESVMDTHQKRQLLDRDVLNLIKDIDTTYFEPGRQFRYSNSGFCLLALVIERVSGKSFPDFIKQRIFAPLHMDQSFVYQQSQSTPRRAMGYAKDAEGRIRFSDQSLTSATKGDGGVYTSLIDYQKWSHALQSNTLLNLRGALTELNFSIAKTPDNYYGAGWFYTNPDKPALFHSGSTCGFSTFVVHMPDTKFLLVYFSNLANNEQPFRDILKVLSQSGIAFPFDVFTLHNLTR